MSDRVRTKARELAEELAASGTLRRYRKARAGLEGRPELLDEIRSMRSVMDRLYHGGEGEDLLDTTELIEEQFAELMNCPEATEYMEAEEELMRLLRDISSTVVSVADIKP